MKRPLAYITAAWCGSDAENAKQAAQYCRSVYEAGFSPICPTLFHPLFLNDAIPEEHKSGIDMARNLLKRAHVLVVCGHITVQTSGGNTFYIVIDYDKPVDEDGEQYETYFFSIVDEADLLAAMEAAGMEVPACACTDKCMAGAINTDCPVCATNMTECVGVEPEPVEDTEPVDDPEPEQPEDTDGNMGTILLILAIAAVGGGAGWYFKVYRPKQQRATEAVEEDYGDELDAFDDLEDDTPPWDEDEV